MLTIGLIYNCYLFVCLLLCVSKGFKLLDKRAVLGSSASSVAELQASLPTAAILGQKSKTELQCIILCLLYKVQCFMMILGTDKTNNLTCEIIYDNFTCQNYCFSGNHSL